MHIYEYRYLCIKSCIEDISCIHLIEINSYGISGLLDM